MVEDMCYERETTSRGLCGTREEPSTLTQGGALFSPAGIWSQPRRGVCVYYCSTYYKAVRCGRISRRR
jgi:hypothetical protein